ncbi:hypothetical protein XBO1_1370086 [Xenorhabdus bovienii str. oregonense]|uniref:Uncharacterized protein n=1 Tax=Xenorhabdus bovienii str. oregonense TaxID=1398202 RepID=A0A077P1A0_XENBV|nr:hypothetical protein XBO1_1370086 [Xenorhabdus bovienii str. oregonense]
MRLGLTQPLLNYLLYPFHLYYIVRIFPIILKDILLTDL